MYLGNITHARLIEDWTKEVLEQYMSLVGKPLRVPVPIFDIAEHVCGLRCDIEHLRGVVKNASGVIIPEKRWVILRKGQPVTRLRYTLAHEVAHWLIDHEEYEPEDHAMEHISILRTVFSSSRGAVESFRESTANYVAGALLMPPELVLNEASGFAELGWEAMYVLAAAFGVSREAMRIRLEQLAQDLRCSNLPRLTLSEESRETPSPRHRPQATAESRSRAGLVKVRFPIVDHDLCRKLRNLRKRSRRLYVVLDDQNFLEVEALLALDCVDGFVRLSSSQFDSLEKENTGKIPQSIAVETVVSGSWYHKLQWDDQAGQASGIGAATVTLRADGFEQMRIHEILDVSNCIEPTQRLPHRTDASQFVRKAQKRGKRVVIVTGCFDLLTSGHVQFLKQAKECGDVLLVGLENDTRVRAFKGPLRPVNTVSQRLEVMDALECVDYAFAIAGSPKTPLKEFYTRLHGIIRADVLAVTENDPHMQDRREEIEADGGELIVIPRVEGNSSTSLLRQFLESIEYSDTVLVSKRHLTDFARKRGNNWRQLRLPLDIFNEAR